MTVVLVQQ